MFLAVLNFIQSIDRTTALYFFSALAQCAAGFAALVGVFAVFRLQANTTRVGEEYVFAKHWLRGAQFPAADSFPSQTVKEVLNNLKAQNQKSAGEILDKILNAEAFSKKLTYKASKPLKWWGFIFFFSSAAIPFTGCLEQTVGVLAMTGFLISTGIALWKTKRFIQKCLSFE